MSLRPSKIFLTGASGFLGRYLLRDLLLGNHNVVVLARSRGPLSSHDRIEALVRDWETRLGRRLIRPQVLDGDIRKSHLGVLDRELSERLLEDCTHVLHSAASLRFDLDVATNEPRRTNVDGTKNLIRFAKSLSIPHLHYISTAYVCGRRTPNVNWDQKEVARDTFNNAYEESKYDAEGLVKCATGFETKTIYRPSIIVGDSRTGFTSTFHTIYSVLRFLRGLPDKHAASIEWIFERLGLQGDEAKNLVCVDWVSHAILSLMQCENAVNQIHHLTHDQPVTAKQLTSAIRSAIESKESAWKSMALPHSLQDAQQAFETHLDAYRGYLSNDPLFPKSKSNVSAHAKDTTMHASAESPVLPPPPLNQTVLKNLFEFAIEQRFSDPTPMYVTDHTSIVDAPSSDTIDDARVAVDRLKIQDRDFLITPAWSLRLTGPYGGVWNIGSSMHDIDPKANVAVSPITLTSSKRWVHLATSTWHSLIEEVLTVEQAFADGRIVVCHVDGDENAIEKLKEQFSRWLLFCRAQLRSQNEAEPRVLSIKNGRRGGRRFAE